MYLYWLKFQAFMKDCSEHILDFILMIGKLILVFLLNILSLIRDIVYLILCVISFIANFIFLASLYYGYNVYTAYKSGIAFSDIPDMKLFLFMFFIPIGIHIVKEIVRPKM